MRAKDAKDSKDAKETKETKDTKDAKENKETKQAKIPDKNEASGWRLWGLFNRDKKFLFKILKLKLFREAGNKISEAPILTPNIGEHIIKESSMPDINIPKLIEPGKDLNDKGNEIHNNSSSIDLNKQEVKSDVEHVSRKNSLDDINLTKTIPSNPQKKGIITWFSEKFSKEKKDKPNLVEDEENKLNLKENKEKNDIIHDNFETIENKKQGAVKEKIMSEEESLKQTPEKLNEPIDNSNIKNTNEAFPEDEDQEEDSVELSICAHLINQKNEEDLTDIFDANKVTEEQYFKDPIKILSNPNLMVKIEDHLYEWKIAEPLIIAKLVFHQVIY